MDGLYEKAMLVALGALIQSRPTEKPITLVAQAFDYADFVMLAKAQRFDADTANHSTLSIRSGSVEGCVGGYKSHSWDERTLRCKRCSYEAIGDTRTRLRFRIKQRKARSAIAV